MKATARTVSGRTAEEGLAECESAMAQEKDIAECVAETDRTVQRSESRIRSRAKRTLLGRERRSESRSVAEDKRARQREMDRKTSVHGRKWRGRELRRRCAEEICAKVAWKGRNKIVRKMTRWRKGQEGAERQDRAEEDEIVQKTKLCRRRQDRAEERNRTEEKKNNRAEEKRNRAEKTAERGQR